MPRPRTTFTTLHNLTESLVIWKKSPEKASRLMTVPKHANLAKRFSKVPMNSDHDVDIAHRLYTKTPPLDTAKDGYRQHPKTHKLHSDTIDPVVPSINTTIDFTRTTEFVSALRGLKEILDDESLYRQDFINAICNPQRIISYEGQYLGVWKGRKVMEEIKKVVVPQEKSRKKFRPEFRELRLGD
ncbi:hypothetical protein RUND412_007316 [Rhizina undulata]